MLILAGCDILTWMELWVGFWCGTPKLVWCCWLFRKLSLISWIMVSGCLQLFSPLLIAVVLNSTRKVWMLVVKTIWNFLLHKFWCLFVYWKVFPKQKYSEKLYLQACSARNKIKFEVSLIVEKFLSFLATSFFIWNNKTDSIWTTQSHILFPNRWSDFINIKFFSVNYLMVFGKAK